MCTVRHHRQGVTKLCSCTGRTVWLKEYSFSHTSVYLQKQNSFWGVPADVTALSIVYRFLEMWDYQHGGATVLSPPPPHNVVGACFTQQVPISVSTQLLPVDNQLQMVKFTVSKRITKTSMAICHLLSLMISFQYAAGGQRPSLHAHFSRPKNPIVLNLPCLRIISISWGTLPDPRDSHQWTFIFQETTSNVLHTQIKLMVWMAHHSPPLLTGRVRVVQFFTHAGACVGTGKETTLQTAVATLDPCIQIR